MTRVTDPFRARLSRRRCRGQPDHRRLRRARKDDPDLLNVLTTVGVIVVLAVEHAGPHYPDLQQTSSRPLSLHPSGAAGNASCGSGPSIPASHTRVEIVRSNQGRGHRPRTTRSDLMLLTGPESAGDTARPTNAGCAAPGALLFPSSGPKIGFSNRHAQCSSISQPGDGEGKMKAGLYLAFAFAAI
jgi:hypothetical protein